VLAEYVTSGIFPQLDCVHPLFLFLVFSPHIHFCDAYF
jgi:hypothetical protein